MSKSVLLRLNQRQYTALKSEADRKGLPLATTVKHLLHEIFMETDPEYQIDGA